MKRKLAILAATVVVGVALIGRDRIAATFSNDDKPHVQAATLERELRAVPLKPGDSFDGNVQTFDKAVIVGATVHVASDAPFSDIAAYYAQTLPRQGWLKESHGARSDEEKFCKAGTSLVIQLSPGDKPRVYYLGVVWTRYRSSQAYCAI